MLVGQLYRGPAAGLAGRAAGEGATAAGRPEGLPGPRGPAPHIEILNANLKTWSPSFLWMVTFSDRSSSVN
jgi:hypothetical protein